MDQVALTSRWIAAVRARETEREDRLFEDPLAAQLAGPEGFAYLDRMVRDQPDGRPDVHLAYLVHRTRHFDDLLHAAAHEAGIRQIVILASGMDARAFRMPWPEGTTVFEVDVPEVHAVKSRLLAEVRAEPRCARVTLAMDLREAWTPALRQLGFDPRIPTAWLIEGLFMYLDTQAADALTETVSSLSAPGSRLVLDLFNAEFLQSPRVSALVQYMAGQGAAWRHGVDEPEQWLAGFGWRAEAVQPGELPFGRWPLRVAPRSRPGIPRSFFVHAKR